MSPVLWGIAGWLIGLTVVSVWLYWRTRRHERYLRAWRQEWAQQDDEPLTYYEDIDWAWPR